LVTKSGPEVGMRRLWVKIERGNPCLSTGPKGLGKKGARRRRIGSPFKGEHTRRSWGGRLKGGG